MRPRHLALLLSALPLLVAMPAALAETWVAVGTHSEVDTDSIHRDEDGLVHYLDRDPPSAEAPEAIRPAYEEAFDCQNMISYVGLDEADWKNDGRPVNPNTHGSALMDFVCSHAPALPEPAIEPAPAAEPVPATDPPEAEPTPPQP